MTTTNKKMTYSMALEMAIDALSNVDFDQEALEKLVACKASYDKRNSSKGERKPTKKQLENQELAKAIMEFINDNIDTVEHGFTCSELSKVCPAVEGFSPQKISALTKFAVNNGMLSSVSVKSRTYFIPYREEQDGE
jgi:Glu-tRNA(Gln) amidotransferase subunit E-like FAD-binding protein